MKGIMNRCSDCGKINASFRKNCRKCGSSSLVKNDMEYNEGA